MRADSRGQPQPSGNFVLTSNKLPSKTQSGPLAQLSTAITGSWLHVLLLFAPVSWYLAWQHASPVAVFLTAALSLVPAAGLIGLATEQLARHAGPALGGFLNATFGNAAELIIAIMALRAHHVEVVKASIDAIEKAIG